MIQLRIDDLAALAEAEGDEGSAPYLVTMVGDSTMMQQHGLVCAYLAEREGRQFDSAVSLFFRVHVCLVCVRVCLASVGALVSIFILWAVVIAPDEP